MNLVPAAAELLSERLGLSREFLADTIIARALHVAFEHVRPDDRVSMAGRLLAQEGEEWQRLVDEAVVPETWFFRHAGAFRSLGAYVKDSWRPAHSTALFHALTIPCASGEEPYSIAITLLNAGLDAGRIRIDAADVSERLLARARLGVYGQRSFREKSAQFHEEYFLKCEQEWHVRDDIVRLVRFERANLLDLSRFLQRAPYDVIFCRNALIYLNAGARREIVSRMRELLNEDGLLFTGPSELPVFCAGGYVVAEYPRSFACRKAKPEQAVAPPRAAARTAGGNGRAAAKPRAATPNADRRAGPSAGSDPATSLEQAERFANHGDLDAATSLCTRLLQHNDADPNIYALLGVISESAGKVDVAEEFFRKALYLAPAHYESLLHMSLLCERRGDIEGAGLYRARAGSALNEREEKRVLTKL